jgi:chromosome segregation ATPase
MITQTEAKIDQCDFKAEKQRLVAIKLSLSSRLAEINSACKVRLPQNQYATLQRERGELSSSVAKIESEISQINQRLAEANAVLSITTDWKQVQSKMVREIVTIRDKCHETSFDENEPASVRRFAFKVSQELRAAMKPYFDHKEP